MQHSIVTEQIFYCIEIEISRYVHSIEEGQTASDSCFDSKKCFFEEVSRNLQSALSVTQFIAIDIYWSTHFQQNCVVFPWKIWNFPYL